MKKPLDLQGEQFGKLTVLERKENNKHGNTMWLCVCECGKRTIVNGVALANGHTKSCGCLKKEIKHGHSTRKKVSPEYRSWSAMHNRCNNPSHKQYQDYGGRGIKICERWNVFGNFLADMGLKPSSKHTIERINNDGNYEPSNCCWLTSSEQKRNQRLRSDNTTGVKGVSWNKREQKYKARIGLNGHEIHLGYFELLEDATRARQEAEQKYWGKAS